MAEQERSPRCEVCGVGGTLVQFGDRREYHYHCLRHWREFAEQVVAAYVERTEA
jgi:hypothetical protein